MRRRSGWSIGAVVLAVASAAGAQPNEAEKKAAAQALFDEAQALTSKGNHADACPKLAESLRLDPSMGTRFYLAECLERTGKLASAWGYYVEVADAARAAGQKAREKYAADRAEALKPRLPKLSIKVPEAARAAGLSIKRNGAIVGDAAWGIAIPVDPGTHAIAASAPGKKPWASDVEVKQEGQLVEITVPVLEEDAPAPPPPPPQPPRVEVPPPPPPPQGMSSQKIAGFVTGAAGVVGLGVSFGLGGMAIAKKNESNANGCDAKTDVCNEMGLALRKDALGVATGSSIAFGVGLAALGAGVVLIATAPSASQSAAVPRAALGPSGASLTWRW